VRDGGQTIVLSLALSDTEVRLHDVGPGTIVSALTIAGMRAVVRVSDATTVGELALLDLATAETVRFTNHWGEALPGVEFLPAQPVRFEISDGTIVHGWLLRAPETEGSAPTLLDIHGGPHNAWTGAADTAHLYHQMLAARGWNIVMLNPRASDGYGEAFYTAALGHGARPTNSISSSRSTSSRQTALSTRTGWLSRATAMADS
jgi:dipeptidyl aminopeptidase/acylaminoacyl peptidase